MPEPWSLAVAVLAAGRSSRFEAGDKLLAPLAGMPLGVHVCDRLAGLPAPHRWVVTACADHPCMLHWKAAGFTPMVNRHAATGLGSSVALAAQLAEAAGADALLIALADMPLVPFAHFAALIERGAAAGRTALVGSSGGGPSQPPALFGCKHFPSLQALAGERGAQALLARAEQVRVAPSALLDIDDASSLARVSILIDRRA